MDVYISMYAAIGIRIEPENFERIGMKSERRGLQHGRQHVDQCKCGSIEMIENSKENDLVCFNCGLVQGIIGYEQEDWWNREPYLPRKRAYKPLTHFKDHLRRYLGVSQQELPLDLKEKLLGERFNLKDRRLFVQIKRKLKQWKYNHFYREIFHIIYWLGGRQPDIDSRQIEYCYRRYNDFTNRFSRIRKRIGRHSMPSHFMVLDCLLREVNHEPFYRLPTLKSRELRSRVENLLLELNC